jgi:hypothetical protein
MQNGGPFKGPAGVDFLHSTSTFWSRGAYRGPTGVALTIANYWEDHPTAQPPHTCASVDSWPCLVGEKIVFSTFWTPLAHCSTFRLFVINIILSWLTRLKRFVSQSTSNCVISNFLPTFTTSNLCLLMYLMWCDEESWKGRNFFSKSLPR